MGPRPRDSHSQIQEPSPPLSPDSPRASHHFWNPPNPPQQVKHQATDNGGSLDATSPTPPPGAACELDGNGLKAFIRRHQGEIDAQLERSTSCTLKTGFRYFYRFLDTLPRRADSIVEDANGAILGGSGGGGTYARHGARFRPRAGTSEVRFVFLGLSCFVLGGFGSCFPPPFFFNYMCVYVPSPALSFVGAHP
jgi:hypothetical protein